MKTKLRVRHDYTGLKVEKGIPIPNKYKNSALASTLRDMEVGDSFVLPKSRVGCVIGTAMRCKIKVTTRTISKSEARVWRVE